MAKRKKQLTKFKNIPTKKEQEEERKVVKKEKKQKIGLFSPIPQPVVPPQTVKPVTQSQQESIQKEFVTPSKTVQENNLVIKQPQVISEETKIEPKNLKEPPNYFPKISRVITEKWFLVGVLSGVLIICIAVIIGDIRANLREKSIIEQQRTKIQQQITYWQENVKKYPGYRDGYFQLAILEYQLGDIQTSRDYVNKVEVLDPNFQEAYKLEKILESK